MPFLSLWISSLMVLLVPASSHLYEDDFYSLLTDFSLPIGIFSFCKTTRKLTQKEHSQDTFLKETLCSIISKGKKKGKIIGSCWTYKVEYIILHFGVVTRLDFSFYIAHWLQFSLTAFFAWYWSYSHAEKGKSKFILKITNIFLPKFLKNRCTTC